MVQVSLAVVDQMKIYYGIYWEVILQNRLIYHILQKLYLIRLKNDTTYGSTLYFGDREYAYISEKTDDDLTIHATDLNLEVSRLLLNGQEVEFGGGGIEEVVTSGSGNIVSTITANDTTLTVTKTYTINSGTTNRLAYYSASTTIDDYSSTVGSSTNPIYLSSGVPTACSYSINANINSGLTGYLAYYSSNNTISRYTNTIGSSSTPIYISNGLPSVCAYSLSASVNSGVSGRLAYYSSASTIDDYSSTIGSGNRLWYLNSGVPTTSTTSVGSQYTPIYLSNGYIYTSEKAYLVNRDAMQDSSTGTNWNNLLTAGMYFTSTEGSLSGETGSPGNYYGYGTLLVFAAGTSAYGGAITQTYFTHGNDFLFRTTYSGSSSRWQSWNHVLTNRNYTSYTVDKTGSGASGTWSISITGNAGTATRLQTSRTIWGQSFNGSSNISGALSNATTIQASTGIASTWSDTWSGGGKANPWYGINWQYVNSVYCTTISSYPGMLFHTAYGNAVFTQDGDFGIGTTSPQYRLHVNSTIASDTGVYAQSWIQVGQARLRYNSSSNSLYVEKSDGSIANFYATGEVSAYGDGSGSASIEATSLKVLDVRNDTIYPEDYDAGLRVMFRANESDSLMNSDVGGSFHAVIQINKWSDSSGGRVHQMAFGDNNTIWTRVSNSACTNWESWKQLGGGSDGDYLPLSGGTMSGDIDVGGNHILNANYYSLENSHGRFAWDSITNHTWLQGSSNGHMTISGLNASMLQELILYASDINTSGTLTLLHSSFGQGLNIKRNDSNNTPAITYSNNSATLGRIGVGSSSSSYPNEPLFYPGTSTTPEKIWTSGNDGSNSGLDADLLDGTHKSELLTAASSSNATNLSITVGGTTKTISSIYADYLGGTSKANLFSAMSYSSNKLSVTIGGTTRSVTIQAGSSGGFQTSGEVTGNWNNYTTTGAYKAYTDIGSFNGANAPSTSYGYYGILLVFNNGETTLQVFIAQYNENRMQLRISYNWGSSWSGWKVTD